MQSRNQKKHMFDAIPKELQIEIFQKLPVKTLVCCICVCKSWNSLIKDPTFISNLSKNNNTDHNLHLTFCFRQYLDLSNRLVSDAHHICIDNQDFNAYKLINFPLKSERQRFRVVNSINGLICLLRNDCKIDMLTVENPQYILWNPSIQKYIILPAPNLFSDLLGFVGFGYDSSTDDYKLLRMTYPRSKPYRNFAEVFSLNAGSWKIVDEQILPQCRSSRFPGTQAVVNGVIHWIASIDSVRVLMAFDLKDETFQEIILPGDFFRQAIHPLVYNDSTIGLFCDDRMNYNFWLMKEYGVTSSWSKVFNIAKPNSLLIYYSMPLGCIGEELFFRVGDKKVESINLVNGKIIRRSSSLRPLYDDTFIGTYKESLVLLNR